MHDCPNCGQACYCDMDDTDLGEAPPDCCCECYEEDELEYDEDAESI